MNSVFETRRSWGAKGFRGAFTKPLATYREAVRYPVNQDEGLSMYFGMFFASGLWMLAVIIIFDVATDLIVPEPTAARLTHRISDLIAFVPAYGLMTLAHLRWGLGEIAKRVFG